MWRTAASRKGRHITNAARKLATEAAPPKQNVPPPNTHSASKSGGFKALKFIGLSLPVAAGGVLGYAWYDLDFRKQMEDNIPYVKELFGNILPKNEKIIPTAGKNHSESPVEKANVSNVQEDAAKNAASRITSRKTDDRSSEKSLTTALHEKEKSEKRSEKISPSDFQSREEDEKADNAALEVVIHKLTTNSLNVVSETVKAQTEVAACIRNQTKMLKQAMDDTSDILMKDSQWESVAVAYKERELAMARANELLAESKKNVEKLRDILQEGRNNRVTQNNPAIFPATKQLNEFLKELGAATLQVRQAEAEANVMQKYKDLVEKGKKQFQKEIESIIPSIKFGSGKKLTEDELSALIAHAHRRIEQLQKQIAEQLALERQRLTNALEAQRQENLKMANMALVEERQNMEREFEVEKAKLDVTYLEQVENEVRKQLARQAAAHSDHLRDVLSAQQQSLSVEFNQTVHVKLLEERERFQSEVAGWISRLKGIEAAVEARATSEKLARCAQDLWLACIALNSVIHASNENEEEVQLKPLKSNVDVILEAGQKHPFVETVASAIPEIALDRGVNTEDELRQRFYRVSRICRRLGLVDAENSSVYKYIISYLHSFVVLDNVVATVEGEEVDLTNLDNFGLLSHAHYWMEKGNLDIALRFMIQLTGESRRAASDWIEEARLLMETKQIADTLMAYASATGLANTY
uniref:MICOS complex subunit MIC60 n=1 Tax=Arion vulgaris TaxID=1028688 RepID=A0A0B7B3L1_9EUPU